MVSFLFGNSPDAVPSSGLMDWSLWNRRRLKSSLRIGWVYLGNIPDYLGRLQKLPSLDVLLFVPYLTPTPSPLIKEDPF